MSGLIEVSVDNQGCIVIPPEVQARLGLLPGMTLIVEERDKGEVCLRIQKEPPALIVKGGACD